jgi:hypothetical protein
MWFYGWMFWLVPLFFFSMMMRRRRWERWQGERSHGDPRRDRELEEQRSTIDALETRVMQLEERLDFTERLLAGRAEAGRA